MWTIPNAISAFRIALIFVFAYLLITERDGWAIATLVAAGISDFLDGYLARRWHQESALGRILDPAADRLLTIAVVVGLGYRDIVPWWLVAAILARDVIVGAALLIGKRQGASTPAVTRLGKRATFALYVFLPFAYLTFERWDAGHAIAIVGATLTTVLYWIAGWGYVRDVARRARV